MKIKNLLSVAFLTVIYASVFAGSNLHRNDDPLLKTFIKDNHRVEDKNYQFTLSQQPAWQKFVKKHPGWMVWFNESNRKPHRATGAPIMSSTFGNAQQCAFSFLQNDLQDFHLPMNDLILRNVANGKKYNYVNFTQYYKGVEVLWSNATVKLTSNNEIMLFGLDVYDDIVISITPTLTEQQAIDAASKNVFGITSVTTPVLKVLPVPDYKTNNYHLVYELTVLNLDAENIPAHYYTLIDANTGDVIYRQNKVAHLMSTDLDLTSTVYPTNPYNLTSVVKVKYAQVIVNGQNFNTNDAGYLGLNNSNSVNATIYLQGLWSNTKTNGTTPVFNTTLNVGNNSVLFDPHSNIKELTAYNNVNSIHDYYKVKTTGQGCNNVMDFQMGTNVDVAGSCNAFYNGEVNFFDAGGACGATSIINDVVYHEYGHGINDDLYSFYGGNFSNGALGEGYADTWANGLTQDPVLGIGFYTGNPTGFVRRYDIGKKVFPQDLVGEVHGDGEIIAGCWWDCGLNFGSMQDRQDLFIETYAATLTAASGQEGQLYHDVLIEALTDDDNDGNLANGTPRFCEITSAFAIHGITMGGVASNLTHTPSADVSSFAPIPIDATITSIPSGGTIFAHYRLNMSNSWTTMPLNNVGGNNYSATIPGIGAGNIVHYYLDITDTCGTTSNVLPHLANDTNPNIAYNVLVGFSQLDIQDFDNFQGPWTVTLPTDNDSTGDWTIDIPVLSEITPGSGIPVQPDYQNTPGGLVCALTGNAPPGSGAGMNDVDGGYTTLISPPYDLTGDVNPAFTYARWYTNDQGNTPGTDYWQVAISNDNGTTWVPVEYTNISDHSWRRFALRVTDYITPTSTVKVRFIAEDANVGSLIEGLVDDLILWDATSTAINEYTNIETVHVFPNPANNTLNVRWNQFKSEEIKLLMTDAVGNIVYSKKVNNNSGVNQIEINTSEFEPGIYFVRIADETSSHFQKISIMK